MDLALLSQADAVTLQLELARSAFENARAQFENAKMALDELLTQAEERGFSRAKLKKLAEDRVQALVEAGLVEKTEVPRKERAPRKPKAPPAVEEAPPLTN